MRCSPTVGGGAKRVELSALIHRLLRCPVAEPLGGKAIARWASDYARSVSGGAQPGLAKPKGNVPAELTSFVGRDTELDSLSRRLATSRLVTVVGPGGVGKTRLALRTAQKVRRAFPDGTWLVDLGLLRDPTLLAEHVAASLGLRDESGRWLVATLSDHLARRRLLLVLDNCEHLVDSCAALVRAVLQAGSEVRILATSREPLGLTAESLFHVGPLDAEGSAIQLLSDRASAVQSEFELSDEVRPTAVEVCRRLDGIPLAIELAAARLRGMALEEVLARLDDRLGLLTSGDRSAPARQQTLRATLDWSHELLSLEERILLRRLGVFMGTFDIAAATAICNDHNLPASSVLDVLTHLVERSIVQFDDASVGRYRMLETIREYAGEKAASGGELVWLTSRHRDYYLGLARQAIGTWASGEQVVWFRRLSVEYDNLRQALDRSRDSPETAAEGADIAARLWLWWQVAGRLGEGRRWIAALLDAAPAETAPRGIGLFAAGFLALSQRDIEGAEAALNEALELAREADDEEVQAYAIGYLALVRLFQGLHGEARAMFLNAVERHRRGGRPGMAAFHMADAAIAATLSEVDSEIAMSELEESLKIAQQGGDVWTQSHALWGLGLARLASGDAAAAEAAMRDALALIRDVGDATGVALALEGLAASAAALGQAERAAWLTGLADGFWDAIPASPPAPVLALRESRLAGVRRILGERRFAAAVAAARGIDPADAVAWALGEERPTRSAPPAQSALTRREHEVAALIAEGLSNREVAHRLVLSPRTVESHVERIMNRLGVGSRTEIATWVTRNATTAQSGELP